MMLKTTSSSETSSYKHTRTSAEDRESTLIDSTSSTLPIVEDERRIRPEELAEAIRTLEKRHQTISPGTLPLTDAIQELGSPFTSEEIWKEVEAIRADQTSASKKKAKSPGRSTAVGVGVIAIATTLIALALIANIVLKATVWSWQYAPPKMAAPVVPKVVYKTVPFFIKTATTKSYGEIKNGEAFSLDPKAFLAFQESVIGWLGNEPMPASQANNILVNITSQRNQFDIVKIDGKAYIRGYVREKFTPSDRSAHVSATDPTIEEDGTYTFSSRPIAHTVVTRVTKRPPLAADAPAKLRLMYKTSVKGPSDGGPANVQVQIPVEDCFLDGSLEVDKTRNDGDAAVMRIWPRRLDKHAWEPWKQQPLPPDTKAK